MSIIWKYLDKRSAAVDALKDYSSMKFIIGHTDEEIKSAYEKMGGVSSPQLDGMPRSHNPQASEERIVKGIEEIDVLKVSHHGSDAATSAEFLSLLAPDCAVISVGAANAYGHPAEDTLERLYRSGAAIYRTDFFGTVRCRVRAGKSLEITSQATENV